MVRPSLTYNTVIPIAIGGFNEFTTADRMLRHKKIIVHGDGQSPWTVTHATDFAKGLTGLMGLSQAIGEAYHITSDEVLSWDEIYKTLAGALGVEVQLVHIPVDFICEHAPEFTGTLKGDKAAPGVFDNSKIKLAVPGFKANIPFHEGIRQTLSWLNAHPDKKIIRNETNARIDRLIELNKKNIASNFTR